MHAWYTWKIDSIKIEDRGESLDLSKIASWTKYLDLNYWNYIYYLLLCYFYRGKDLNHDMLYEPIISDNEEKEGDKISGNRLFNLHNLATNIEKFYVAKNAQRIRLYKWKFKRKDTSKSSFLMSRNIIKYLKHINQRE